MKNILFASDLDNTLLYSYKYKKKGDICVEFNKGKEQGFMTQKMIVEFDEGKEPASVMSDVVKACKKVEPDCEIFM